MLVERYLPLARRLAQRYARSSEPLDDLIQVACLGLLKAIARYDTDGSHALPAFAIPTILGELRRHFRDNGWRLHVPRSTKERVLAIERATRELTVRHGRAPTVSQLSQHVAMEPELVLDALQARHAYGVLSLDSPSKPQDGASVPLVDTLGGEDGALAQVDARATLAAALPRLRRAERELLLLRFAGGLTQSEIAARYGVSQMTISRRLKRCLGELRAAADGTIALPSAPPPGQPADAEPGARAAPLIACEARVPSPRRTDDSDRPRPDPGEHSTTGAFP